MSGSQAITGDIIRATLETTAENTFVLSIYAGTIRTGETTVQSGLITVTGSLSGFQTDITSVTEDEVTTLEGTSLSFALSDAQVFMTANARDYQRYSVQMELFDYAVDVLSDLATPTYEFSLDTTNFIFS